MTKKDFNDEILYPQIEHIKNTLDSKGKEYSGNIDDVFHVFNLTAKYLNEQSIHSLRGMMAKHLTSVLMILENPNAVTKEQVDEKFGDLINYLILAKGIMYEKHVRPF